MNRGAALGDVFFERLAGQEGTGDPPDDRQGGTSEGAAVSLSEATQAPDRVP
ncbi:hypothetical protein ACFQE1_12145 [Halobium palmae]|uniref:Uncharacterized protein n=1 Tax=Halobium palmae TaxID=1776492 RepID=A0ABD5S0M0_9EURY